MGLSQLAYLDLSGNRLHDLSSLPKLAGIDAASRLVDLRLLPSTHVVPCDGSARVDLDLSNNAITDLAPLLSNERVPAGCVVNVHVNPFNVRWGGTVLAQIEALSDRGIEVLYDESE